MKNLEELRSFFDNDLKPELETLEEGRLGIAKKVKRLSWILWTLFFVSLGLFYFIGVFAFILAGALAFTWIVRLTKTTKGYTSDFKAKVISRIVKFIDRELSYDPTGSIPVDDYMASRIFRTKPDLYRGDDLVTGRLGKTEIAFSEIHSQYKSSRSSKSGSSSSWHTIFKGLFFIADFNKSFKGETYVLPEVAEKVFGKILGNIFQSWNKGRGQLVKMEDDRFEKHFVVYGDDQIEARYILSTSLMKRIADYREKTKKNICISFINNKIYVALFSYKDLFEPKLFKTLLDFGVIREYYEDLAYAVGLVDELNLNTRIWR